MIRQRIALALAGMRQLSTGCHMEWPVAVKFSRSSASWLALAHWRWPLRPEANAPGRLHHPYPVWPASHRPWTSAGVRWCLWRLLLI